ncbi:hypothetical protein [Pseudoroseicyclus tamaricis]|uniref:Uncharacterized protein n=1 Tax=Pseudoroseicyclus tamaricis TaxID=2705421 RepID=A0A6B2JMC0_9RHOB|nr:hypothetical protein [Pseudoroseicyclus tamaricis]NDV02733.1 hypothetical protein [Pseudoroseicyclus tamaricis]
MRYLTRQLIAIAAAFALVLPLPARAEEYGARSDSNGEEIGQLLIGLAVFGIAAHVLAQASKRNKEDDTPAPAPTARRPAPQQPFHPGFTRSEPGFSPDSSRGFSPASPRGFSPAAPAALPRLPSSCAVSFETLRGAPVRIVDQDCLARRFAQTSQLPASCNRTIRIVGGVARGFDVRCLQDEGYRFSAR